MNIVLFGFMGTGKTAVGKIVSKELRMRYVSTDEEIVQKEKRPIKEIFEKDKEPYFRLVEKAVVDELSVKDNLVIDTGGGVPLNEENVLNLGKNGILVLLTASEDVILKRIGSSGDSRPLLNVDNQFLKIKELLEKRAPYYDRIPNKIDTSGKSLNDVALEVIRIYKKKKTT